MLQRLDIVVEAFGARLDEFGIKEILADDDIGHGLKNSYIGAGLLPQPERGEIGQLNLSRIDDD